MYPGINFTDIDELDRQYDIAIAVPDMMSIVEKELLQSANVRASHENYQELSYGSSALQTLDYFPTGKNSPLLVYIHGGYWARMDKAIFSTISTAWNEVGISVAVINYRLAPDASMTDIVSDARQSIAYLWHNADDLAFNKNNIVVSGSSAGGHLTAMMLATDWPQENPDLPKDLLKGGVSISGLHDLEPFLSAPFLKDVLRLTAQEVQSFSPARLKPATQAPLITCVGGDESPAFHAQNALMSEHWSGVFKQDIPSPGTNHVTVNAEMTDPQSRLFKAVRKLFE